MRFAILALLVLVPHPSDACSKRHQTPFEVFDLAVAVAIVHVTRVPGVPADQIDANNVELVVTRIIKGTKTTTIMAGDSATSCRGGYVLGQDEVVFLDKNGFPVGAHDGVLHDAALWGPIIEQWSLASDPAARATVLADAAAGKDARVADEAMMALIDDPALLDAITADQTAAIAKAAKGRGRNLWATMLLVRLHDPSAPARAVAAIWSRAARGMLQAKAIAAETDVAKLADIIAKGRLDDPRRMAAMEHCERIHGTPIARFEHYFGGPGSQASWTALAAACRTGTPASIGR